MVIQEELRLEPIAKKKLLQKSQYKEFSKYLGI